MDEIDFREAQEPYHKALERIARAMIGRSLVAHEGDVAAAASAEAELEVAAVADRDPAVTLTDDGALQDWKRIGGLVGAAGLLGLLVADIAILLRREDRVVVGAGRQSLRSRGWLGRLLGGLR